MIRGLNDVWALTRDFTLLLIYSALALTIRPSANPGMTTGAPGLIDLCFCTLPLLFLLFTLRELKEGIWLIGTDCRRSGGQVKPCLFWSLTSIAPIGAIVPACGMLLEQTPNLEIVGLLIVARCLMAVTIHLAFRAATTPASPTPGILPAVG